METDLTIYIRDNRLYDTHEHTYTEQFWVEDGPDILQDLFGNYVVGDLEVAGASPQAIKTLLDKTNADIPKRFAGIKEAWEFVQHTGYGEAVRIIAKQIHGIDAIEPNALIEANKNIKSIQKPGERLRLLKEVAGLDHVQIDGAWAYEPDTSGPEFFLHDISWAEFSSGCLNPEKLQKRTGISLDGIRSLEQIIEFIFDKYGPTAIAVKSQHAYDRTLYWRKRDKAEVEKALQRVLNSDKHVDPLDQLIVGDYCLARGVELSIEYNLPFKLHTGYYYGTKHMLMDRIQPSNLCPLLIQYPHARFVLMHVAYPYCDELVGVAKHFPNVWVDLCWGWAMNPLATSAFVRHMIHASPINKVFAFGGDSWQVTSSVAYAIQARKWLAQALQAEVDEGMLTVKQAKNIADLWMYKNADNCFDIEGTRSEIMKKVKAS